MDTREAAEYLRSRGTGVRAGSHVEYIDVELEKLGEIAELLENCYGCGRCFNTLKKQRERNINTCGAVHHSGCGCDLDWNKVFTGQQVSPRDNDVPHVSQASYDEHVAHLMCRQIVPNCLFCKRLAETGTNKLATDEPPDDVTHYQLNMQTSKGLAIDLPTIRTHAFVSRYRAKHVCGWTEADGMVCGYPKEAHIAAVED